MNQQDNCEDNIPTKSLPDLPLTGEQTEVSKAGTSGTLTGTFRLTFNGQTTY